jgi:hypothetical protein
MIQIDRNICKKYKDGELSTKDVADYLLRTYPVTEIALALAETMGFDFKPITITQEEFSRHFRIRGVKPDGTPENRGKRKDKTP